MIKRFFRSYPIPARGRSWISNGLTFILTYDILTTFFSNKICCPTPRQYCLRHDLNMRYRFIRRISLCKDQLREKVENPPTE